jgi:hypothetical protein
MFELGWCVVVLVWSGVSKINFLLRMGWCGYSLVSNPIAVPGAAQTGGPVQKY